MGMNGVTSRDGSKPRFLDRYKFVTYAN
jgi:hypothetical protein